MRFANFLSLLQTPQRATIAGVVLGLVIGLLIGWVIWPVEWINATPDRLSQRFQEEYLRMAIDSYRNNKDAEQAVRRWKDLGPNAPNLLMAIAQQPGSLKPNWILDYKTTIEEALGPEALQPGNRTPAAATGSNRTWLIVLGLVLALGVIGGTGYLYLLRPRLNRASAAPVAPSAAQKAQAITKSTARTDFAEMGLAPPITQTMTTYVLGDDLYDESFSIDAPDGNFLGEYGVGISKTILPGAPKKVTAMEVWLFDKNDIKTATKVLMTPYAYQHPDFRRELEAKGELVLLRKQEQILLETATLQLMVTVVDVEYGKENAPENSYLERLTLEMAVWQREQNQ